MSAGRVVVAGARMIVAASSTRFMIMAAATDRAFLVVVLAKRMIVSTIFVSAGATGLVVVAATWLFARIGLGHVNGPPKVN